MNMLRWIFPVIAIFAASSVTGATRDPDLKLRVKGYVETMLKGDRAAMLKIKDYYGVVYLASSGSVEDVTEVSGNTFRATLRFQTVGLIQQNAEVSPHTSREIHKKSTLRRSVIFRLKNGTLQWIKKLDAPFVLPDHESRYLLVRPSDRDDHPEKPRSAH